MNKIPIDNRKGFWNLKILVILNLMLLPQLSSAQFNILVGYTGQNVHAPQTNSILGTSNTTRTPSQASFETFRFMHGLNIGVRYHWESGLGMEVGWQNCQAKTLISAGSDPTSGQSFRDRWNISSTQLHIGFTQKISWFGLGTAIGTDRIRYSLRPINVNTGTNYIDTRVNFAKIFFNLEASSRYTSFMIRPFFQWHLGDLDLAPLSPVLPVSSDTQTDKWKVFGIQLIIGNGPQN